MRNWQFLKRPPWRTLIPLLLILMTLQLGYLLWQPGTDVRDGRHDLGRNGLWLQHGWLGDDSWFERNKARHRPETFRNAERLEGLAARLRAHHIRDVFPHLCPTLEDGTVSPHDCAQTERLLDALRDFRVMPWVGGAVGVQAFPANPAWRERFATSIRELLLEHPRLTGVHVNLEPWPSGDPDLALTLSTVRRHLPEGRLLSVAAYPPPTRWQPYPEVHWDEAYYRRLAPQTDQMAIMMYDTGLRYGKFYQHLMSRWTRDVLTWTEATPVLLGLPAYNDADTGYHVPDVENLTNTLRGVHAGLAQLDALPPHYQGVALYSEWEMDGEEWRGFTSGFLKPGMGRAEGPFPDPRLSN